MNDNGDAAFLAEVTGFLDDYEAPLSQQEGDDTARDGDALLLDSHLLIAETEALLSSLNAPSPLPTNVEPRISNPRAVEAISTRSSCRNAVKERSAINQTLGERRHEVQSAQAAKRRLEYREKVKDEWRSLQQEESALSAELLKLQRARAEAKKLQESSLALSVWRAIATRQMEGRLVAEAQHRRLETAVENRAKVIQEVGSMLHERLYGSGAALPTGNGTLEQQSTIRLEPDDTALYEDYLQDLAGIYAQTDEVFRLCGVEDTPEASFRREPKRRRDGELEFFENLDVLLIPFDYQKTCSAMWQAMTLVYRQKDRQHYEGVTDPDNTMAVKFRFQCPGEADERVEMVVRFVMRRYVEANRLVIVWRALSEGEGEYAGMHSDETGWCVVRPLDTNASDSVELPTVMQTFIRFVPMNFASGASGERNADQFTKLVVISGEEDGLEVARMMESLLLDDSHSHRK
ncbi:hypothetical protein BBJ28_00003395 [Nothophytophthora sp. Chile5]|nr:hypothetical protein BBJ28_00003395 [Nothophytophthora sp. Chile5]